MSAANPAQPADENATITEEARREEYLQKYRSFFMRVAHLAAQQSKDDVSKVGACVINRENRIVGVGYNGMVKNRGEHEFSWKKEDKPFYVCHAELNAILSTYSADLKDYVLFVTRYPCNECAKMIIQSDIKRVIYGYPKHIENKKIKAALYGNDKDDKEDMFIAAKHMFDTVGVTIEEYEQDDASYIDFEILDAAYFNRIEQVLNQN